MDVALADKMIVCEKCNDFCAELLFTFNLQTNY